MRDARQEPPLAGALGARFVEELSLNAWPSLQTVSYDGWLLRFADGYTRRANSVNPLYPSSLDLEEKIRHCQLVYESVKLDTVFKITPATTPANLDAALADKGYAREAQTSVQIVDLRELTPPNVSGAGTVTTSEKVSESWVSSFCQLSAGASGRAATLTRMLECIVPRKCLASLNLDGEPIAIGMAVLEQGHVGLYDIVTAASHRNRGFGKQLVSTLLAWGKANGAEMAYLNVMCDNSPALRLYASVGFREAYTYWYRIRRRELIPR